MGYVAAVRLVDVDLSFGYGLGRFRSVQIQAEQFDGIGPADPYTLFLSDVATAGRREW